MIAIRSHNLGAADSWRKSRDPPTTEEYYTIPSYDLLYARLYNTISVDKVYAEQNSEVEAYMWGFDEPFVTVPSPARVRYLVRQKHKKP
jgi:hypothetical protein